MERTRGIGILLTFIGLTAVLGMIISIIAGLLINGFMVAFFGAKPIGLFACLSLGLFSAFITHLGKHVAGGFIDWSRQFTDHL